MQAATNNVPNFLQSFKIITKLSIHSVSKDLGALSILNILLSVQEPDWDLELLGMLNDRYESIDLIVGKFSTSSQERKIRVNDHFKIATYEAQTTTIKKPTSC